MAQVLLKNLLYLLGILLHPDNTKQCLPVILTGPKESEAYFKELCEFIEMTLGKEALDKFEVIIDNPAISRSKAKVGYGQCS